MINSSAPLREVTPASAMILFKRRRLIIRLSILDSLEVAKVIKRPGLFAPQD
jgi:hypothetical protein